MAEILSTTCMPVLAVAKDAVYVRLPRELQRDIAGGCDCLQCKVNPALAKWDTLVVPIKPNGLTHAVHMPDDRVQAFLDYLKRREGKANG